MSPDVCRIRSITRIGALVRLRAERADEAALVDAEIAPLRDVAVHGIVERDAAFLDQHHQREAGERLGHRIDAEDRVFLQRPVALDVHAAERAQVCDLAVALDERQRARQLAGIQILLLQEPVDVLQARAGAGRRTRVGT